MERMLARHQLSRLKTDNMDIFLTPQNLAKICQNKATSFILFFYATISYQKKAAI